MCGILAIVSPDRAIAPEILERALDRLAHRGPDDRGVWCSPRRDVGLGHTRLGIIDLHTGRQPIVNEDGSVVLSANGEFYDHERISGALEARGHTLRTRSDSEVALHLYEELGVESLRLLRGEFAYVIWDAREQKLFAPRDRFGIKPLFYAQHAGALIVASEIKALLAAGVPARWDREAMFQSLHLTTHPDRTLFDGVRQVPPGHYLTFQRGLLEIVRYWDADYPRGATDLDAISDAELIHETGSRIEEAVRLRMRADVPVACYLSGGVDSSSVLGIANMKLGNRIDAFTISFDHEAFDEDAIAREMAAHGSGGYHPIRVTNADFAEVFADSVEACEGIQFNGHAPARYILSREVRRAGYKVVLGGEGADELFLGYHFAQRALHHSTTGGRSPLSRLVLRVPDLLRAHTDAERFVRDISPLMAWASRIIGFPHELLDGLVEKWKRLRALISREFIQESKGKDPYRAFLAQFDWRGQLIGREPVRQVIYLWLKSIFPNYVLAAERLDMAHAVELRLPYLDHHLFEFLKQVPARRLYREGQNKHLLRRTVRPYVTRAVYDGKKQPFFAPPSSLISKNPLTELIYALVDSPRFREVPFFEHREVARFLSDVRKMEPAERASFDPLLYMLASIAVLNERYRLTA